jgi:glucose dehydrogenase
MNAKLPAVLFGVLMVGAHAQELPKVDRPYTTWSEYAGSADSMQHSALTQITKTNVANLQPACSIRHPANPSGSPSIH